MGRKAVGILLIGAFMTTAAPALAHHSMAAYEPKPMTLQGVVSGVRWVNPHWILELAVPAEDGKMETWLIEGGYVNAALNAGITPQLLKIGTTVKVFGRGHRDHTKHMAILNGIEVDGKYYVRGGGDFAGPK